MVNRESDIYQQKKLACELVSSELWTTFLKPMLDNAGKDERIPQITDLASAIAAARYQARLDYVSYLKAHIERLALTFKELGNNE